ncbi:MAG: rhomboid family intramembrane serine protease [Vulcanimicrobiota bacterium]
MFFLPYGDENPTARTPYVNYMFIALNTILFLGLGYSSLYPDIINKFAFTPSVATPYTYITSAFLHGDFFHLFGNMLYLYIAGDNVEDKLGHVGYFVFFLLGAAAANLFHMNMVSGQMLNIPTLGASGAVSAVLGAYIVLFPKNKIKFFYFFIIFFFIRLGTVKIASFWAIGLWFILQLFSHTSSRGYAPVAYGAHIGGFIVGVIIVGLLVITGVISAHWKKEKNYNDILLEDFDWGKGNATSEGADFKQDGTYRGMDDRYTRDDYKY